MKKNKNKKEIKKNSNKEKYSNQKNLKRSLLL